MQFLVRKCVPDAQNFASFTGKHARVGGHAVVVIESRFGTPRRDMRAAGIAEHFLEAGDDLSRGWVAGGDAAARAGLAAPEIPVSNEEAHRRAVYLARELVLPGRRHRIRL